MAILIAGSTQLINFLGLISGGATSMTESNLPDAQAEYEKGLAALAAGLAGRNLIYESAGMFGSLLRVSFEGFVIENSIRGEGHPLKVIRHWPQCRAITIVYRSAIALMHGSRRAGPPGLC
ncbi:trimethylamine:corrinoid methyltransferase [Ruegeria denitrificans]|uniref:Trimethylamine:corrinoid methyltransferase n=2 Tax=Ruegeria denitrificans TaxID=1715692 RepID=A0A0P1IKN4_9RHOB|nr:trimethylamine:corrinoid methyltransferase [Ruegeria denitrificans]